MELQVINAKGASAEKMQVSEAIFTREYNEALIHQLVVAFMAGERQASKAQKTRSEVSGGGQKPFRQKGTGRARAGTSRGPIWIGGGRAFAARSDRNYAQKVNRKMYRGGMASIFAELIRQDRLVVLESIEIEEPKTKLVASLIASLGGQGQKTLFIDDEFNENFVLGALNIPNVYLLSADMLNPCDLVAVDKVFVSKSSMEKIGAWLS